MLYLNFTLIFSSFQIGKRLFIGVFSGFEPITFTNRYVCSFHCGNASFRRKFEKIENFSSSRKAPRISTNKTEGTENYSLHLSNMRFGQKSQGVCLNFSSQIEMFYDQTYAKYYAVSMFISEILYGVDIKSRSILMVKALSVAES